MMVRVVVGRGCRVLLKSARTRTIAGVVLKSSLHFPIWISGRSAMRQVCVSQAEEEHWTATNAKRILIIVNHEKRRFPERVDYVTSPGWLEGGKSREKAGIRWGAQPK